MCGTGRGGSQGARLLAAGKTLAGAPTFFWCDHFSDCRRNNTACMFTRKTTIPLPVSIARGSIPPQRSTSGHKNISEGILLIAVVLAAPTNDCSSRLAREGKTRREGLPLTEISGRQARLETEEHPRTGSFTSSSTHSFSPEWQDRDFIIGGLQERNQGLAGRTADPEERCLQKLQRGTKPHRQRSASDNSAKNK
jgi:hypothetical protein